MVTLCRAKDNFNPFHGCAKPLWFLRLELLPRELPPSFYWRVMYFGLGWYAHLEDQWIRDYTHLLTH